MPTRNFTREDQRSFADLSGDHNPMHVDPVAARRYIFGKQVVHGIHAALWALDSWLEERPAPVRLRSLNARFLSPIALEEPVQCFVRSGGEHAVQIEIKQGVSLAIKLTVEFDAADERPGKGFERCFPERTPPLILTKQQIRGRSGRLALYLDEQAAARLFPHLVRSVPALQISVLLSTTRLVGMECPGYHSIYSQLELSSSDASNDVGLNYAVASFDDRFNLLSMKVSAPGMTGVIKAFIRPAPQEQRGYLELAEQVKPGEFAAQRALIIGGSRGLGEVTAKLLAAGGAKIRITYHRGKETAERIVDECVSNGAEIDCVPFDVLDPVDIQKLATGPELFSHLYFFATPFISGAQGFSPELFSKFCDYYVTGFVRVVDQLVPLGLKNVFYPSSAFVEEVPRGMGEYAAAKAAGESLCVFLQNNNRQITIYTPRLPKMATDQTASLLPADNQDAAPVILQNLRSFRDLDPLMRKRHLGR